MPTWDKDAAIKHLNANARNSSAGLCGRYTREAIEAGGLTLTRQTSAKDYGASLILAGFQPILMCLSAYERGDVVIIEGFSGSTDGHMAMFNGEQWVSDFKQRDLYPGPGYRSSRPKFTIYRYGEQ